MSDGLAAAYGATGRAWADGPSRIYGRLAEELCGRSPVRLDGARMLDLGAGTGAATRAGEALGAHVVAVDIALGMLAARPAGSGPSAVGDALALPFGRGAFDVVIAAFSLNHLEDPVAGLREAARVLRPGGGLVAAAYAEDDGHPVKAACEAAATAAGWTTPPWYAEVRARAVPQLATVDRAADAASRAGLDGASVEHVESPFDDLGGRDLVAWRLGMAQVAPFLATLSPAQRAAVAEDALARLGVEPPPLVRRVIVLTWTATNERR